MHHPSAKKKVENKHLYLASKRPIKDGDWFWSLGYKKPVKCIGTDSSGMILCKSAIKEDDVVKIPVKGNYMIRKIEATTDPEMEEKFPLIPASFISKFVDVYKTQKKMIKEVCIDINTIIGDGRDSARVVKRKDGTVILSKIQNNWTTDEVKKEIIAFQAWLEGKSFSNDMLDYYFNLKEI
jgi:hypothetical protein